MSYSKTVEAKPTSWFNCIFRWRMLQRGLVGIVVLSLFYAEENWRGKRAWAAYQRVLKAKGLDFNWRSLAPAPVVFKQFFRVFCVFRGKELHPGLQE